MAQRVLRILMIVLSAVASVCATAAPSAWDLYRRHDFFALHAALLSNRDGDTRTGFLRAADAFASGRYQDASLALRNLLSRRDADRALEADAREFLMLSERARFRYSAAFDAIEPLLREGSIGSTAQQSSIRNRAALLTTIKDVLPETSYPGKERPLVLTPDGTMDVQVNDLPLRLLFDTGANFSILSRSAARNAGLETRRTDYRINGATGTRIRSDVTSGSIKFGDGTVVSNVIFLVLPDTALHLPDGRALPGAIGFPVISALGAIRHLRRDRIVLGGTAGVGSSRTGFVLSGSDPLLQIEYRGQRLACRLDTGAIETVFYEPFLHAFPYAAADAHRARDRIAGISGVSAVDDYRLTAVRIALAGRIVELRNVRALARSIDPDGGGIFCNIGRDVLDQLGQYTLNFADMTFSLP
jgi:hypothetical protein